MQLGPGSPCIDAGNPASQWDDASRPPPRGTARNDMGAFGGPLNTPGDAVRLQALVDHILGRAPLGALLEVLADLNGDGRLDTADVIVLVVSSPGD
ncbi:MAG: hypothetical protein Kow0059_05630 [Candidatus Sumerlaeia bacterium]